MKINNGLILNVLVLIKKQTLRMIVTEAEKRGGISLKLCKQIPAAGIQISKDPKQVVEQHINLSPSHVAYHETTRGYCVLYFQGVDDCEKYRIN